MSNLSPDVAAWRSALVTISAGKPPCRYLTPSRWAELREACLDFCNGFGAKAHAFNLTRQIGRWWHV